MYESSREILEFSEYYRGKAHNSQRTGHLPGSTPNLQNVDDMVKFGARIQASLSSLREVALSQEAELAEQSREKAAKLASEESQMQEEAKGAGGFAGSDPKKRRGVSLFGQ